MSNYVACELGAKDCRIMFGTLENGQLTMSEVRRFQNQPIQEKDSVQWNIPHLFQETIQGLRGVGSFEEAVDGISCNSWGSDYLLFESDGSLITPAYHHADPRSKEGMKTVFAKIPWETIYEETGVQRSPSNTLFQLGSEKSKRLSRACHLMPVADAFNYLLAGVARIELTTASSTQLYNPVTRAWSNRLLSALRLPSKLFPPVVDAGTELGPLRPEIAKDTHLEDATVMTSCSHQIAASLLGIPLPAEGESWAYLWLGSQATIGVEVDQPIISEATREWNYTNALGYHGSVRFQKAAAGLYILEECRRFWGDKDRELDGELLVHLAGSAPPFASLINPEDPRFMEPGDMPLKVQAFCRETRQPMPRKPGAIFRCILESLALHYRKTLREIEAITGRKVDGLCLMGNASHSLLHHFTASAVDIPIVIAPEDAASVGNVVVQALALGHISSLEEARQVVRSSSKMNTIIPRATAWDVAYDRLLALCPA